MEDPAKKTKVSRLKEELWLVQFNAHVTGLEKEWHQNMHIVTWLDKTPTREVVEELIYQFMKEARPITRNRLQKYPIPKDKMKIQKIVFTIVNRLK